MRNSSEGRDRDTFASLAHGVSRDRFVRFKTNISTNYWTQNRMQTYHLVRLIYFQCFPCFNQPGQPFVYHPRTKLSTKKSECLHTQPCCLSTARCPYSDFLNKMIGRSLMAKKNSSSTTFSTIWCPFSTWTKSNSIWITFLWSNVNRTADSSKYGVQIVKGRYHELRVLIIWWWRLGNETAEMFENKIKINP